MSAVIGPNKYLPGQTYPFKPDGRDCDCGECGEEARHAVVTETDSMGSEVSHLSTPCFLKFQQNLQETRMTTRLCDVCHEPHDDVKPMRDPDEGQCGRVYDACSSCRTMMLSTQDSDSEDDDGEVPDDFENFIDPDDDLHDRDRDN